MIIFNVGMFAGALAYYVGTLLADTPFWRKAPKCDRCGKSTGRPELYSQPRTRWHCWPCDRWYTDTLFRMR